LAAEDKQSNNGKKREGNEKRQRRQKEKDHLPTIPLTVTTRCEGVGLVPPSPAAAADVPSSSPAAETVKHPGRGRHAAHSRRPRPRPRPRRCLPCLSSSPPLAIFPSL